MPKRKAVAAASDEGEDYSEEPSAEETEEEEPVSKKKQSKSKKGRDKAGDNSSPPSKKTKSSTSADGTVHTVSATEKYILLGKQKRATVRTWKGMTMLDIREYYTEKGSGQERPGKKGISLTEEQWKQLCECSSTLSDLFASQKKKAKSSGDDDEE